MVLMKFKSSILFTAAALGLLYIFGIEPYWLNTSFYELTALVKDKIRIVQISDIHTRGLGRLEKSVLEMIDELKPDVIVLTGDVADSRSEENDVREVLEKFKAPLGVFFVIGNWEYWTNLKPNGFLPTSIKNLNNRNLKLVENLWLIGFDDVIEGTPDIDKALRGIPKGAYKVALFHSPIFYDSIYTKVNLSLSGHTHGGQVRIPFLPPIWVPEGSGEYVLGWYEKSQSKMYVSRGIGTSILPIRLFCRPEIVVIDIKSNEVSKI